MIREIFPVGEMKKILIKYHKNSIEISPHYLKYLNVGKRDLSQEEIIKF